MTILSMSQQNLHNKWFRRPTIINGHTQHQRHQSRIRSLFTTPFTRPRTLRGQLSIIPHRQLMVRRIVSIHHIIRRHTRLTIRPLMGLLHRPRQQLHSIHHMSPRPTRIRVLRAILTRNINGALNYQLPTAITRRAHGFHNTPTGRHLSGIRTSGAINPNGGRLVRVARTTSQRQLRVRFTRNVDRHLLTRRFFDTQTARRHYRF